MVDVRLIIVPFNGKLRQPIDSQSIGEILQILSHHGITVQSRLNIILKCPLYQHERTIYIQKGISQ